MLRSRGLRVTAQRQLVLAAVLELGHATPDQVLTKISESVSGVNITTVYRTLELLEDLGLVTHAHLSHGATTYHGVADNPHIHLVCRVCHAVDDVPATMLADLAARLRDAQGFSVDVGHVALFGVCAACGAAGRTVAEHATASAGHV
jgi:Fur family ferric uptake transcriptional regulator